MSIEKLIFEELDEIVPLSPVELQQFHHSIQHPKLSYNLDDSLFETITDALTNPSQINDEDDTMIKRSYRVMTYIIQDLQEAQEMLKPHFGKDDDDLYHLYLLNPTRATLLAKKIFAAYRHLCKLYATTRTGTAQNNVDVDVPKAHIPHLNKTLSVILDAFPTQVVGASCAGGEKGVEMSLKPMLELHKHVAAIPEHSPMATMAQIITIGCSGRKKDTSSFQQQQQQQQQQQMMMMMMGQQGQANSAVDHVLISNSHRRKFVHGFTQWGGFSNLIDVISHDIKCADEVSDVLLSTVEFISFPQQPNPLASRLATTTSTSTSTSASASASVNKIKEEESVGEEALLSKLASEEMIQKLFDCITDKTDKTEQSDVDAVSSALLGLFELATGKARKLATTPPESGSGNGDDGAVECKATTEEIKVPSPGIDDNKMVKAGITDKMHAALNAKMDSLVSVLNIYMKNHGQGKGKGEKSTESSSDDLASTRSVKHPGRYTIEKPFTSNRLQLLTLFTDLVSYESHCGSNNEKGTRNYNCATKALDTVMDLPVPPANEDEAEEGTIYNPWPGICDLLFDYPENNMFQFQFYRLIHALCATNHENTLKLIVQKCKFLSRAIKTCSEKAAPSSTRGVLLRCLNALRLHSQSVSPHSFLRHYLESHDGWKAFQDELKRYVPYLYDYTQHD